MIKDDRLLVMKRSKFGRKYLTLIGGEIEQGETNKQALRRELKEETGMTVKNLRLVFEEEPDEPYGTQYVYLCDYISGEPKLSDDSIEAKLSSKGQNLYEPIWLPINKLEASAFVSEALKLAILSGLKKGWPKQPITL